MLVAGSLGFGLVIGWVLTGRSRGSMLFLGTAAALGVGLLIAGPEAVGPGAVGPITAGVVLGGLGRWAFHLLIRRIDNGV